MNNKIQHLFEIDFFCCCKIINVSQSLAGKKVLTVCLGNLFFYHYFCIQFCLVMLSAQKKIIFQP